MANRNAWITPQTIPAATQQKCRRIRFRDQIEIEAAITGALYALILPENWEQVTGVTVEATVEVMQEMFFDYLMKARGA